jgi:flagellar hook-associated protein 2
MKNNGLSFIPGAYSFDLNVGSMEYEFQYNVNEGDTNRAVMDKLAKVINSANLGIDAAVLENENEESALSLTSVHTGLWENETSLFSVKPSGDAGSIGAMDLLGIHHITEPAQNSDFLLNGIANSSHSNTFTINQAFELTLKKTTPEESPAAIGFKTNTDAVADNIQKLADAYDGILTVAENNSKAGAGQGRRLLSDMSSVALKRSGSLGEIGLMVADNGSITIDRELLSEAITPERAEDTFERLAEFRDAIGQKAYNASVNPMKYVDKVIVEYKDPKHTFLTPYISSLYSGMLLDKCI